MFVVSPTALVSMERVGEEVGARLETPHPYYGEPGLVWEQEFFWPEAGYIAIHFSQFSLRPGDYVEISDASGTILHRYTGKGKIVRNGQAQISEFWATHIPGDYAIVRLYSKGFGKGYGFNIDRWVHGYPTEEIKKIMNEMVGISEPEAVCSADDKEWAKCYLGTTIYDKSKAVCRLLINGSSACTGWILGSQGHIMTNNHCISTQSSADNTDYEFMAEGATCATSCASWGACPGTIAATSGTMVKTSSTLDYTLVLLPTNVSSTYGYLQLRNSLPTVGERIYIPQHPSAWGKQIAVNSDADGGYCKIYSLNEAPCMGGPGDIGYMADTAGGSSGSPVLAYGDHLVVALHHCATCPNRGVPIPSIITDLGSSLPANAVAGSTPQPPVANFTSNKTTVAVGGTVTFADTSTNSPTSWSWSFPGGTPSTSTAQNPTITYNTIGTYDVTLTATNAQGSDSETKTAYITVSSVTYCASKSNNYSYEYIKSVKFGSVTKTSTGSYYSDFTATVFTLTRGASVSFTLTPGFAGTTYTEYWKVWIDYNKDGDFADTGEQIYAGSGKTAKTSSFTVSSGASTGNTRMRVSMKYSATPTYCETFSYGEVEDYTAAIQ